MWVNHGVKATTKMSADSVLVIPSDFHIAVQFSPVIADKATFYTRTYVGRIQIQQALG